ncbi:hypothetical protein MY4824_009606 [Beauveria thailandica]
MPFLLLAGYVIQPHAVGPDSILASLLGVSKGGLAKAR